ncbi:MAG: DUF4124 domain-containing protein [Deltaproteobacteria bacterium]|nr:DUF4124 domain-containing protein [Deltaproteobacteria bacterium]
MRTAWRLVAAIGCLTAVGFSAGASAQEIYKWTDAEGKVHFGNAPPPGARDVAANGGGEVSSAEAACQAKARQACTRQYGTTFERSVKGSSESERYCRESQYQTCMQYARVRPTAPKPMKTLVTERLSYDPQTGDHLVCQMTCPTDCTGSLEIWGAENLARAENPGSRDYTVRVTPNAPGSAYCRSSSQDTRASIVLNLMRGDAVVASATGK